MPDTRLQGERVFMCPPSIDHQDEWVTLRQKNKTHLKPFEPLWPADTASVDYYQRRLARQTREWVLDRAQSFLIFKNDGNQIIGGMNINNICRGAAQYASLGYWIDQDHEGQGYMAGALDITLGHCFGELKLHRVHASCLPHNERSKRSLLRAGFEEEGFAKNYLEINGSWQDHILFGLTIEKFNSQN